MRQTCFPCGSLQKHPCWLQSFSPVQKSHTIFVSCCFSCSQKGNFLCATADKPQSTFPKLKSKTRTFDLTLSLHYSRLCIDQQTEPLDAWIMFVPREIGQSRDQQLSRDTAVRQQEIPQLQPEGLLEIMCLRVGAPPGFTTLHRTARSGRVILK